MTHYRAATALAAALAQQPARGHVRASPDEGMTGADADTQGSPENLISDPRVGYPGHHLDQVLDGELDAGISAHIEADRSGLAAGDDAAAG